MNRKLNPADIGPHGMTVSELNNYEWITWPAWVKSNSSEWPAQPEVLETCDKETKEKHVG